MKFAGEVIVARQAALWVHYLNVKAQNTTCIILLTSDGVWDLTIRSPLVMELTLIQSHQLLEKIRGFS